jgi:hypothetical protein
MTWGLPLALALLALNVALGAAAGAGRTGPLWCVACTFVSVSQPALGAAFPRRWPAARCRPYNLVIFGGVFCIQWGIGLLIDGCGAGAGPKPAPSGWPSPRSAWAAWGPMRGSCCTAAPVPIIRTEHAMAAMLSSPTPRWPLRCKRWRACLPGLRSAGLAAVDVTPRRPREATAADPGGAGGPGRGRGADSRRRLRRHALQCRLGGGRRRAHRASSPASTCPCSGARCATPRVPLDDLVTRAVAGATQGVMQRGRAAPPEPGLAPSSHDQVQHQHQQ